MPSIFGVLVIAGASRWLDASADTDNVAAIPVAINAGAMLRAAPRRAPRFQSILMFRFLPIQVEGVGLSAVSFRLLLPRREHIVPE